jgi:Protein of unknown function (DUF2809)
MQIRIIFATATLLLIAAGLLVRAPVPGLPAGLAKYAGSIIWGGMVYALWSTIMPRAALANRAAISAIIAASVEFSQLLHTPWLDAFRRTTIGVLLIGRFFSWWDILSYTAGIAACAAIEWLIVRGRPQS